MSILATHKETERITGEEFDALQQLLKLLRDERPWVTNFVESLALSVKSGGVISVQRVLSHLLCAWTDDPASPEGLSHGMLSCIGSGDGHQEIDEREFKKLGNYLTVLRDRSWLSQHISIECEFFVDGRRFTPSEVIEHLIGGPADSFPGEIDSAKELLHSYPDLFADDLRALQKATEHEPTAAPAKTRKKAGPKRSAAA